MNTPEKRDRVSTVIQAQEQFRPAAKLEKDHDEKAVIGAVFYKPDLFPALSDILQPGDFASIKRGFIWWAFDQVYPHIDTITVLNALLDHKDFIGQKPDELAHELDSFLLDTPVVANAEQYARSVLDASIRIRLLNVGAAISQRVMDGGNLDAVIDDCNAMLFKASNQSNQRYQTSAQAVVSAHMDDLEDVLKGLKVPMFQTGHERLDSKTGGLGVGEVTVLAGGTGIGKTTFGLGLVITCCERGDSAAVFSLEMTQSEVVDAMAAMLTSIPIARIRRKEFQTDNGVDELRAYIRALGKISEYKLHIVTEFDRLNPAQLRRKLRTIEAELGPIHLCMVDGLWLMEATEPNPRQNWIDIKHIMRDLTGIARDFMVPILLMHQFNDDINHRQDKTPRKTDMAGGREVDRTAQTIWALHSDRYYGVDDPLDLTKLYLLKGRNSGIRNGNEYIEFQFINRRYIEAKGMVNVNLNSHA